MGEHGRAWANMGGLVHGVGGHGRTWAGLYGLYTWHRRTRAGIGVLEVIYKKRGPAKRQDLTIK